jgi:hypothetical protein
MGSSFTSWVLSSKYDQSTYFCPKNVSCVFVKIRKSNMSASELASKAGVMSITQDSVGYSSDASLVNTGDFIHWPNKNTPRYLLLDRTLGVYNWHRHIGCKYFCFWHERFIQGVKFWFLGANFFGDHEIRKSREILTGF